MTNDRILQKEEFIQQYALNRTSTTQDWLNPEVLVKEALIAWSSIRKECDK